MTEFLRVKNWREHQHYKSKDGPPKWIKLHRETLTDYGIRGLAEADRFKLLAVWILASQTDGVIPNDPRYIASVIGVKRIDLELLVSRGFLERVYSESRADLAPLDKRRKEEEGLLRRALEKPPDESHESHVKNVIEARFGGAA